MGNDEQWRTETQRFRYLLERFRGMGICSLCAVGLAIATIERKAGREWRGYKPTACCHSRPFKARCEKSVHEIWGGLFPTKPKERLCSSSSE